MKQLTQYQKPIILELGKVTEVVGGTLIKGHTGILEAIHSKIIPAYDLDDE